MRLLIFLFYFLCLAFFLLFAQSQDLPQAKKFVVAKQIAPIVAQDNLVKKDSILLPEKNKRDNLYNNISAILSGVSDTTNSLNYLYDENPEWKKNQTFINKNWKRLEKYRLKPMQKWASKELNEAQQYSKTVFYPFSGPDFVTANAFFPQADTLILFGLEPVGILPEIHNMDTTQAREYCEDFHRSLNDIFQKSYFITSLMLRDLKKSEVNGTLPLLCFFIKKTGHHILDINFLVKHNQDSIIEAPYNTGEKYFGVKISFEKNDSLKTLYYFKYDIRNQFFNNTFAFYDFVNRNTKNSTTFIKSGSYLLHAGYMSNLRNLIFQNSNYILQDDTGIPYKYFTQNKKWTTKLYGKYIQPVKDFPYLKMQQGIVQAFETDGANIPDIPFHLGYHWQTKKNLLIYALKK